MIILALDCAGANASCALTDGNKLLCETVINGKEKHSVTLLPAIGELFTLTGLDIDNIDLFAVTVGPGSFTGVRIGVAQIKGLMFGKNKPCAAVSTLESLAYNLNGFNGIICPLMDARRGQFYNALFKNGERLCEDRLISAEKLSTELEMIGENAYLIGDGAFLGREIISYKNLEIAPLRLIYTSGYSTAMCALNNYKNGIEIYSDIELSPKYLRLSQAEREREERIKNG